MSNLERAERALDEGLELAAAPAFNEFGLPASTAWCWRCEAKAPSTDVGLCGECHAAMRDESTTAPEPVDPMSLLELIAGLGPEARGRLEALTGPDSLGQRVQRAYMRRLMIWGFATRETLLYDLGAAGYGPEGRERVERAVDIMIEHAEDCDVCQNRQSLARRSITDGLPEETLDEPVSGDDWGWLRRAVDRVMRRSRVDPTLLQYREMEQQLQRRAREAEERLLDRAADMRQVGPLWSTLQADIERVRRNFEEANGGLEANVVRFPGMALTRGMVLVISSDGTAEMRLIDELDREDLDGE